MSVTRSYATNTEGAFGHRMEAEIIKSALDDLTEEEIGKIKNIEENRDDPWIQKLTEEEIRQIQANIAKRKEFDLEQDYYRYGGDIKLIKEYTKKDPSDNKTLRRSDYWTFLDNHSHEEIIQMQQFIINKEEI